MSKKATAFATFLFVMILTASPVLAFVPYRGYTYTPQWGAAAAPNAFIPYRVVYPGLNDPNDFIIRNNYFYIADTGNNRVLVLDERFDFVREITGFVDFEGNTRYFNAPEGIFVTYNHDVYIADTANSQIVVLDTYGNLIKIIDEPESDILPDDFRFFPIRIAVNRTGRVYVIGRGVFHGIMEFNRYGHFLRFLGTNRVTVNPLDYLWRRFATEEQRRQMITFLPTAFNSLEIDSIGFLYTTVSDIGSDTPIQRLNPSGVDVLRRPDNVEEPIGDLSVVYIGLRDVTFTGPSVFVDVTVNEYGMYAVLDSTRGRIFVYSPDAQLLYIFGKHGIQEGTFNTPVGLSWFGENMVVLERGSNSLTMFVPTDYGRFINNAVINHVRGDDDLTTYYWGRVLQLNTNFDLAFVGIGRALLRQGEYRLAMDYFRQGNDRFYFSMAFSNHRRNFMRDNLGYGLTALVLGTIGFIAWQIRKRMKSREVEQWT